MHDYRQDRLSALIICRQSDREFSPARFHFGPLPLPEVRAVFDAAQLDQPLAFAERPGAHEVDLSDFRQGLHKARGWSEWVVLMLREADGCQPTLGDLAGLLNIGERSLTRYLGVEGYNFRDLSLQIRHQRACELLKNRRNSITQIAYLLGYTETANFSRAFFNACACGPDEYRKFLHS